MNFSLKFKGIGLGLLFSRTLSLSANHVQHSTSYYKKVTRIWIQNFVAKPDLTLCPWALSTLLQDKLTISVCDDEYVRKARTRVLQTDNICSLMFHRKKEWSRYVHKRSQKLLN